MGRSAARPAEQHILHTIVDGLAEGLSQFSGPSRAAVVYAVGPDDELRIHDPQRLLDGHEPRLQQYFVDSDAWRPTPTDDAWGLIAPIAHEDFQPAGLVTFAGGAAACAYQMWFTERHPEMCSAAPVTRWLEHAALLLAQDLAAPHPMRPDTSGYVLREYATHAVRDALLDERNRLQGWDTALRIYPTLDAILNVSKTLEEGAPPRGRLIFAEPALLAPVRFLARFPRDQRPLLSNAKHVRKLMQVVEDGHGALASDGEKVVGIAAPPAPSAAVTADFHGSHGFVSLGGEEFCSFSDGRFSSSTRRAKLVHLEEILLESRLHADTAFMLLHMAHALTHSAQENRHGCTLVVDLGLSPLTIPGQQLETPLDLVQDHALALAMALSRVDGAVHIGADLKLYGFGCLLDGMAAPGENRARGARFNSALRFTAAHPQTVAVVVSKDRPASTFQNGVELTGACPLLTSPSPFEQPPLLRTWLAR